MSKIDFQTTPDLGNIVAASKIKLRSEGCMNKFTSIFSQMLTLFPRMDFEKAVMETKAEQNAKGFTSWGQFVAMLFCQLGRAHSLREITGGLMS